MLHRNQTKNSINKSFSIRVRLQEANFIFLFSKMGPKVHVQATIIESQKHNSVLKTSVNYLRT